MTDCNCDSPNPSMGPWHAIGCCRLYEVCTCRTVVTGGDRVKQVVNPTCPLHVTLTASEVKVLTETALRLGRKEAGDEIAETLEALGDSIGEGNQRELLADLADIARDIGSSPLGATWDVRSGVPGHQEVSEAIGSPQEPCGHPTCPCAVCPDCGLTDDHKGGCPQTGEAPQPGAPG